MSKDKLNLIELKIGDELFSVLKEINSKFVFNIIFINATALVKVLKVLLNIENTLMP